MTSIITLFISLAVGCAGDVSHMSHIVRHMSYVVYCMLCRLMTHILYLTSYVLRLTSYTACSQRLTLHTLMSYTACSSILSWPRPHILWHLFYYVLRPMTYDVRLTTYALCLMPYALCLISYLSYTDMTILHGLTMEGGGSTSCKEVPARKYL